MTLLPPGRRQRRPTEQEHVRLELVSGFLMLLGVAAFIYLFYAIATDASIREATQGPAIPGIGVEAVKILPPENAPDQAAYFELHPVPGGPADSAGLQTGDRLVKVDGADITPDMTVDEVNNRLRQDDVKPEDDTFEVKIDFLRLQQSDNTWQPDTRTVPKNEAPSFGVAYLKSLGIILPLLLVAAGGAFIWLGSRLRTTDVVAARWSLVAFTWLMVGLVVAALWAFWVQGKGGIVTDQPFDFGKAITAAIPYLIAIIPLALAYSWLNSAIPALFRLDESLASRNTRFAWSLLVPTLAILILVAGRPLEQTFIKSLTDGQFGTTRPAQLIGFANYQTLLSLQLTTTQCVKDNTGQCRKKPNGDMMWAASDVEKAEADKVRNMTPIQRQHYARYQEVGTMPLPFTSDRGLRLLGTDPIFVNAFGNTLVFTLISVALELLIGLVIALVVNSAMSKRARGLMRTAMLVPWAIPTVVSAVLWQVIMRPDQTGILNKLLTDLGLVSQPVQWLASSGPWMPSIIAVDVWKTAPFMALLILAGLQTIPADIYEAAEVDGASKLRMFFSITLPLLRPTIAVALVFRTLDALRAFDVFQVLLDTTRPSLATYNYNQLVLNRADGYASAVGVLIFVLIAIFVVIYVRIVGLKHET